MICVRRRSSSNNKSFSSFNQIHLLLHRCQLPLEVSDHLVIAEGNCSGERAQMEASWLHLGPLGIPLDAPPPPELDLLVPPVQQLREGAGGVHYARAGGGWIGLLLG